MNGKINTEIQSIKFIFDRNKFFLFPAIIVLLCIVLFFQFIIPQFQALSLARQEAGEASEKLQILNDNLNVIINTDDFSLDSQLDILNRALPLNKDFISILNVLNSAALKAGVILNNFSLQIGDISDTEEKDKFPTISVTIPINADAFAVNKFMSAIHNALPLSEVSSVKTGDRVSTINISFYYKSLDSLKSESYSIKPISQKGLELVNRLRSFQ